MNGRGRSHARFRRALALGVGLILLAQVAPGTAQTTQEKLDRAKKRVKQIERELDRAEVRLADTRADIESLTRQILEALRRKEVIEDQIVLTKELITRKRKRESRLQGRLDERARDAYIDGPVGALEFVLEAGSLTEFSDRLSFLQALSKADVSTAAGVELVRRELAKQRSFLKELHEEELELLEKFERQNERLQAKFEQEAAIRASIADKLAEAEELVKSLRKKLKRELLAALRAAGSSAPVDASGLLKWCPVDQPRSYIDDFGYPRPGGRSHQGNDIFAPEGTPIRAPFAGVADESWNTLGGNSVFVRAPDGTYVYNAHLSRFAGVDGKQVKAGDLIGYVGNTGNAVGTPPHDHFELHPGGGSAISPYAYLNAVCGVNGGG